MPALVDSRPCQNAPVAPSVSQPRRMVVPVIPVIPVIPRTLEKKNANRHVDERFVGSAAVENVTRPPRQPSSRRRSSSNVKDSSSKSENENSERQSSFVAEENKDFRMQPASTTPPSPSDSSQYNAPNILPTQPATFHSNPTPPIDSVRSPTDSSYQGYGHIPHKDFHPQPTPPNDTAPSPIEVSYLDYNHIPPSSFETQCLLPVYAPPSSAYSFYQGYSYGDVQPIFPPHAESSSSQRSSTQSEHDINLHVGNESEVLPSFRYQIENRPPSVPSTTFQEPLRSESKDTVTPAEISPLGLAHAGDFYRTYETLHNFGFHHGATSQSIQDSDDEQSLVGQAESGFKNIFSARGVQYEAWRHATLAALDQGPQHPSLNVYPLTDYLAQEFNTTEHADCRLTVYHEIRTCDVADFLLHSLLIDQSPLLRELRRSTVTQEHGIRILRIRTRDRFITSSAIETALRVCYGQSIVQYKGSSPEICASKCSIEVSTSWMENALALMASGFLFQLETVVSRGLQIASSILNWENIEKALSFAIDGGLDSDWDADSSFRVTTGPFSSRISDDVTTKGTPGSSEAVADGLDMQHGEPSSSHLGIYLRGANDLLLQCLEFILSKFPESWELDILARPLADIDRLPMTTGSRSPLATSRLCQIQFGDHPSEKAKSCDENIVLSSLLLSLPFPLLKYILDRLDETMRSTNINPIVDERERRRRHAVKFESISWSQRQEAAIDWTQAGWKEFVVLENSRSCVQRKWVGFRAPSGAQN